ncbi:hypothetical protein Pmani_003542 [Petrolisthes manimaculis]|uniref:Zinc finger C2H2 LYAR-type domain-containing protein n=1 Tax=Petrolisthes manimaculis TaxID=1843537 RepID=A0AAE1QGC1_9EUCA|nr:hypothetical protein Pmani_003542 [Petrolisthes manimaculis]
MVVFVCSACGDSLKKNKVENHWNGRCGSTKRVSCMDCSKDFNGMEFAAHFKCITENEKYGGSGYVAKENKGEKKQEEWMSLITEQVTNQQNMDPKLKKLLEVLTSGTYTNIPRKRKPFLNFIKNSTTFRDSELGIRAWEIFEPATKRNQSDKNKNQVNGTNKGSDNDGKKTKEEKKKAATNGNTVEQAEEKPKLNKEANDNDEKIAEQEEVVAATNGNKVELPEEKEEMSERKQKKKRRKEKNIEAQNTPQQKRELEEENDMPKKKGKKMKKHQEIKDQIEMETAEANEEEGMEAKTEVVEEAKTEVGEEAKTEVGEKTKKNKKKRKRQEGNLNGTEITEEKQDAKKLKTNSNEDENMTFGSLFDWNTTIKNVLKEGPEEGMKAGKLQKKTLALYFSKDDKAELTKPEKGKLKSFLSRCIHKKNDNYSRCSGDLIKLKVNTTDIVTE